MHQLVPQFTHSYNNNKNLELKVLFLDFYFSEHLEEIFDYKRYLKHIWKADCRLIYSCLKFIGSILKAVTFRSFKIPPNEGLAMKC